MMLIVLQYNAVLHRDFRYIFMFIDMWIYTHVKIVCDPAGFEPAVSRYVS